MNINFMSDYNNVDIFYLTFISTIFHDYATAHISGSDIYLHWFRILPLISPFTSVGWLSLHMHVQCRPGSLFSSPAQLTEGLGTKLVGGSY